MLSDQQQAAVDIIGALCSQRPMPARLAAGGGDGAAGVPTPDGATPMPPTPLEGGLLSPGAAEAAAAAESSFAGTSFEDVTLQAGAGRAGAPL